MKLKSKSFFRLAKEKHQEARSLSKMSWMNIGVFAMVLVVGVAYVAQVNHASTLGYEIRGLERGIDELRVMNENIEYQVAELQSVDNVDHKLRMLGMVPVDETTYLGGGTSAVAVNR